MDTIFHVWICNEEEEFDFTFCILVDTKVIVVVIIFIVGVDVGIGAWVGFIVGFVVGTWVGFELLHWQVDKHDVWL